MKRTMFGLGLVTVALCLTASACGSAPGDAADESAAAVVADQLPGFHMMPITRGGDVAPPPPAATPVRLKNYGGPVIPNVKVYAVYWGSTVQFQDHLSSFYGSITNSTYFDWLKEYDTPTQQIRRGSFGGAFVITPGHTGAALKDADVQAEISAQIDAGVLPDTDGVNALYMLHFPAGIKITAPDNQSDSCVVFCAYHGTFKRGDKYVFYGIHPDLAQQGCSGGCGAAAAQDNTTSVASHEMIEAVTDPGVGMATSYGPPLAWYNQQKGEIGDICNGKQDRVGDFVVQTQWSNTQNKCVVGGAN